MNWYDIEPKGALNIWRFYQHVVNSNYPGGYQTLCANCNNIKQWEQSKYNNGPIA